MAASLLQDLTLLVPTYNRPRFFTRFLDYARASGFDMPILVADGSEAPGAETNADIIARHGAGLTIEHQRYGTDVTPGLRVGIALQTVGTRYCMLCADDDFVFLPKVKEALFRLELEPECVAVGGPMIVFTDNPAKPAPLRVHVAHDVTGPSALQRIDAHMVQYRPTFYSVFRTPAIQAAYNELVQRICPCVIMVHSQGGNFGFNAALAAPDKVRALIAIEPSGAPDPARADAAALKDIPHLVVWGDFIEGHPLWSRLAANVARWQQAITEAGGRADTLDLPKEGIAGNSHMLMMDRNSDEVAAVVQDWLARKGLWR